MTDRQHEPAWQRLISASGVLRFATWCLVGLTRTVRRLKRRKQRS